MINMLRGIRIESRYTTYYKQMRQRKCFALDEANGAVRLELNCAPADQAPQAGESAQ